MVERLLAKILGFIMQYLLCMRIVSLVSLSSMKLNNGVNDLGRGYRSTLKCSTHFLHRTFPLPADLSSNLYWGYPRLACIRWLQQRDKERREPPCLIAPAHGRRQRPLSPPVALTAKL